MKLAAKTTETAAAAAVVVVVVAGRRWAVADKVMTIAVPSLVPSLIAFQKVGSGKVVADAESGLAVSGAGDCGSEPPLGSRHVVCRDAFARGTSLDEG